MSKQIGIRLTDEENALISRALEIEARLGDRGGTSAWARRVILREAHRVVAEAQTPSGIEESTP